MCLIVVGLDAAARYPFLVAANRDERHARPTQSAAWWPQRVLGGRDLAAGGTWLAVDARGRFAAVTNIRDAERPAGLRSRGSLVADFLLGDVPAARYAERAVRDGVSFGAFNLLLYDGRELHFASNRTAASRLGSGLHAFSNAPPGTEWPKTSSALAGAEELLTHAAPLEPLFELLARRDDSGPAELRHQRTHFVVGPTYGTRCSTVVLVDSRGELTFAERTFDSSGALVGEVRETLAVERGAALTAAPTTTPQ
jgi:uncharacterized protein with NRDE domain